MTQHVQALLNGISEIAEGVKTLELRPLGNEDLPRFTAGAHIDLMLPSGLVRSYSLCNSQDEVNRYVIAVRRQESGRGGSAYVHDMLVPGQEITIQPPRNNFRLAEDAAHSVFIAGGIGITPIVSMILRLEALGGSWELHYSSPTRDRAAFLDLLETCERDLPGRVHLHFDDEHGGKLLEISDCLKMQGSGWHYYCCGPTGMLDAFIQATAGLPVESVHTEHFSNDTPIVKSGSFEVEFRRLGKTVTIVPGQTILEAALEAGADVPYSCEEGVCGSCETRVIEGVPDHQDMVLAAHEREANTKMMICCSRAKSHKLVLDL